MVRSCAVPKPTISPTTTRPVAIPIRARAREPSGRSMPPTSARMLIAARTARSAASSKARGKPEIGQDAVAHELGDETAEAADRAGGGILITADHAAQEFGIDRVRQRRRTDRVAEQHRDLATLGLSRGLHERFLLRTCRFGRCSSRK
jgi:hypothetical protein